jgi:hypothetical protein
MIKSKYVPRIIRLSLCFALGVSLIPLREASAMTAMWHRSVEAAYPLVTVLNTWLTALAKEKANQNPIEARDMAIKTEMNKDITGYLIASSVSPTNTFTIHINGKKGKARVVDKNNGEFLYQPFADQTGTDHFTFMVEDMFGNYDYGEVTVIIQNPNNAPVAETFTLSTTRDHPVSDTLKAHDPDGDALTFHIDVSPKMGTVTITDPKTGAFTYTPNPGATGKDRFKFSAHDGKVSSNWGTVTILIAE